MGGMDATTAFALLFGVLALVALGQNVFGALPERLVERAARLSGLSLAPGMREVLRDRLAARYSIGLLGVIVSLAAGWGVGLLVDPSQRLPVLLAALLLGLVATLLVNGLLPAPAPAPDAPRIARGTAARLGDFVPPYELWIARSVAIIGVLLAAAAAAGSPAAAWAPLGAGALTLAALAAFELGARRILARPSLATSEAELAWDDEIRSMDLRELAAAPVIAGVLAVIAALGGAGWRISEGSPLQIVLPVASIAIPVLQRLYDLVVLPQRHVLRRLWPTAARAGR